MRHLNTTRIARRWASSLLALAATVLVASGCGAPEECSSDDDCGPGYKCFRSRSGWVQSSVCAPSDPVADTVGPDGGDFSMDTTPVPECGYTCTDPLPGVAHCRSDRTTPCLLNCADAGLADCDGDIMNGCEVDPATDADNCGACGTVCDDELVGQHTTGVCMAGACVGDACVETWYDLDGDPTNGCTIGVDAETLSPTDQVAGVITAVERLPEGTFVAFGNHVGFFSEAGPTIDEPSATSFPLSDAVLSLRATVRGTKEYAAVLRSDGSVWQLEPAMASWTVTEIDPGDGMLNRVVDIGELDASRQGPELVFADIDALDCAGCANARSVDNGAGVVNGRIIDVEVPENIEPLFFSTHGVDGNDEVVALDSVVGGGQVILRTNGIFTVPRRHPKLIEPWLDEAGRTQGMVLLYDDDVFDLWQYTGSSSNLTREPVAGPFDAGDDVHDIVSLGGDLFLSVADREFWIFSVADGDTERLRFTIPALDPNAVDEPSRKHGGASWTHGDSTLSLAYHQRLYRLPIVIDSP